MVIALWILVAGGSDSSWWNRLPTPLGYDLVLWCGTVGAIYGATTGICWVLTVVEGIHYRSIARLFTVIIGSCILASRTDLFGSAELVNPDLPILRRSLINLGGMAVTQSVLFFFLGIPAWRKRATPMPQQNRQFSIHQILLTTTSVALIAALSIHDRPRIDAPEYWLVLFGIWVSFPLISVVACGAVLNRCVTRNIVWGCSALLLAVAAGAGLGLLDQAPGGLSDEDFWRVTTYYCMIESGNLAVIMSIALAGRFDSSTHGPTPPPHMTGS